MVFSCALESQLEKSGNEAFHHLLSPEGIGEFTESHLPQWQVNLRVNRTKGG
jgi:hypothetical protein